VSVRGDAWGCVAMRVRRGSACHVVAKILKCSEKCYARCHDLSRLLCEVHVRDIGCHAFREHSVTYA